jgi:hypothetical protein
MPPGDAPYGRDAGALSEALVRRDQVGPALVRDRILLGRRPVEGGEAEFGQAALDVHGDAVLVLNDRRMPLTMGHGPPDRPLQD